MFASAKLLHFSDICKKNRQILAKWRFFLSVLGSRFSGETAKNAVSTGANANANANANVKKMLERAFFFAYVKKKLYLCTILVI